jgi:menaquinol-cytochrome c reductase iron-sulfur subunit
MTNEPNPDPVGSRRTFLKVATNALGGLFALVLGIPAIAYLIDARNRAAAQSEFKTVARLSELPLDTPQQVVIRDVRRDAWTIHPSDVIGRVWLIRRDKDKVEAFTTICPHLGCSVNYEDKEHLFVCPCHGGTFDADGHRKDLPGQTNPAPRGMDRLECRLSPANPEMIEVKYQNFMQGKDVPIPKT